MRITSKISSCDNGTCPAIMETDEDVIAFQGTVADPAALGVGDVPGHEAVVLLPRQLVEDFLRGRS